MIGQTISHYRVLEKIGEGGMGEVYLAEDTRLDRKVALKFLPQYLQQDEVAQKRFMREAKSAAAFDHPYICKIYETGEADGRDFIAMEFLEGETLRDRMKSDRIQLEEALQIASEIAEALEKAHRAGIVHRDLKPANIMLTEGNHVKIMDFGLAKKVSVGDPEQEVTAALTEEGTTLGTLTYMSPEQLRGQTVDTRSDIFSFGVILYQMLTGQHPFKKGTGIDTMKAILVDTPSSLRESRVGAAPKLQMLLERMLAKDREERYQSIEEVRSDLSRLTKKPLPVFGWAPSRRMFQLAVAVLGLAVMAMVLWQFLPSPVEDLPPLKTRPFTSEPGAEYYPDFSPDGKRIVFSWWTPDPEGRPTANNLYIAPVQGIGRRQLTNHPGNDLHPAWHPAGLTIAFCRYHEGEPAIFTTSSESEPGQERKLASLRQPESVLMGLSWSLDGEFLAFSDKDLPSEPWTIHLFSSKTGETIRFIEPQPNPKLPDAGDLRPAFSPDGHYLAFCRRGEGQGLWVVPSTGGEPKQVTAEESWNFAWTADSKELVFSSEGLYGLEGLWRVRLSGGAPRRIPAVGEFFGSPAISTQGNLLAYTMQSEDADIWQVDLTAPELSPSKVIDSTRIDAAPDISPDGLKIAFVSTRTGGNGEVWVCNHDGTDPIPLTGLGEPVMVPKWSHNGRQILFRSSTTTPDQAREYKIWVIDSEGGSPRLITREGGFLPSWSSDGDWVYYQTEWSGESEIWKLPAVGGEAVRVIGEGAGRPVESSDGQFLYYVSVGDGPEVPGALWQMPAEGGPPDKILDEVLIGAWGLTDYSIYYINFDEEPPRLEFCDLESKEITPVAPMNGNLPWSDAGLMSVSRNGDWLAYVTKEIIADIMLVENFR